MSVRYVLTAVLPRYTMRSTPRATPAARAARGISYPPQFVAHLSFPELPDTERLDRDVMLRKLARHFPALDQFTEFPSTTRERQLRDLYREHFKRQRRDPDVMGHD